jgi:hypothetical protein
MSYAQLLQHREASRRPLAILRLIFPHPRTPYLSSPILKPNTFETLPLGDDSEVKLNVGGTVVKFVNFEAPGILRGHVDALTFAARSQEHVVLRFRVYG